MDAVKTSGRATVLSSSALTRESKGKNISYRASCGMRGEKNRARKKSLRETHQTGVLSLEIISSSESFLKPAARRCNSIPARYADTPILHHSTWPDSRATTRKVGLAERSLASSHRAVDGIHLPGRYRMHGDHNVER